MTDPAPIAYDVATALWQGARPYQEDTLLADFHGGMDRGFAVLADGMGGHAAGDLASRLVVIDAASHLKFLMHDGAALEASLESELTSAIETANTVLKDRAADDRRLRGMGTTFLATVIFEDRLYWASVGDSPLYLWREGALRQLNEDHSMAPVIDQMARAGEITQEQAAAHPDRNALTSVLMGDALKAMDVPDTAIVLDPGDVLIQASDGLQYLHDAQISDVVARGGDSRQIADALMSALRALDDPGQDNTAILVLQLADGAGGAAAAGTASAKAVGADAVTNAASSGAAPKDQASRAVDTPDGDVLAIRPDVVSTGRARRWVVPAGLVGGAAVVAGLMFGVPSGAPNGAPVATLAEPITELGTEPGMEPTAVATATLTTDQPEPEAPAAPDAAGASADAAPQEVARAADPSPAPAQPPAAPAPASPAATATIAIAPVDTPEQAGAADLHEIVGETAALSGGAATPPSPLAPAPSLVGDKPSQTPEQAAARVANGATIPFEATEPTAPAAPPVPGTPEAPGANAVTLDLLVPEPTPETGSQVAPLLPSQDAVDAQPASQRTQIPDGPHPKLDPPSPAKPTPSRGASHG